MVRTQVGVLRGGTSHEYEVSLATGGSVLKHLPAIYRGHDILIDRVGVWHWNGLPTAPEQIARQMDVFFNALHGEYGEDGKVQGVLEQLAVPYTGSEVVPSALGMNKVLAKEIFRRTGLRVPTEVIFRVAGDLSSLVEVAGSPVFNKISPPWIVKPADRGSSVGLVLAKTFSQLVVALNTVKKFSRLILVEAYLRGREATCGVVDNFRGHDTYALPPIEIRPPAKRPVWNYEDKYSGATQEICPATFSEAEKHEIEKLAVAAHRALGLRHYSRSDFILTSHGIYLLETNSLPGLTSESLLPKALAAVGCPYPHFLDHVITLAVSP